MATAAYLACQGTRAEGIWGMRTPGMGMGERFHYDRCGLIAHFSDGFDMFPPPQEVDDRYVEGVVAGVLEQANVRGLFVPTRMEIEAYRDPCFADGALADQVLRAQVDTVRDVLRNLKGMRPDSARAIEPYILSSGTNMGFDGLLRASNPWLDAVELPQ